MNKAHEPNDPGQLILTGRVKHSITLLREQLKSQPNSARIHHNLGIAEAEASNLLDATKHLEIAVSLIPDRADYHRSLAVLQSRTGDMASARQSIDRALDLDPKLGLAWSTLSSFRLSKSECLQYAYRCDGVLNESHPDKTTIEMHFAAGHLYDRAEACNRAFSHFRRANELKADVYDARAWSELAHRTTAVFRDLNFEKQQAPFNEKRIVFIVGMPRSGSTLLEQALTSHPDIQGGGERSDLTEIIDTLNAASKGSKYPECIDRFGSDAYAQLAETYYKRVTHQLPGALVYIDKRLFNFLHLGLIALLFPNAVIVNTTREPLDVALSCYMTHFSEAQAFSSTPEGIGHMFRLSSYMIEFWKSVLPIPILTVQHEDTVNRFRPTVTQVLKALDLEWHPDCRNFDKTDRFAGTASYLQVREPLNNRGSGRWKKYKKHMDPFRKALWPIQTG